MPQTIALQRGTTTVTSNSTSSVTLFTQSGGIATRVILNQLGLFFSNDPDDGTSVAVFHNISGGQSLLIGFIRDSDRRRSTQFIPGATPENPFLGTATQVSTTTAVVLASAPNIGGNGATGVGSSPANGVSIDYASNTNSRLSAMPSNFYIGPGDSLSLKVYASRSETPLTASITYSFTTITET